MRPRVLVPIVLMLSLLPIALAANPEPESAPQDPQFVEYAARAALSAWSYNELWRLYSMGSKETRASLSERDFVDQMEKGGRKLGVGVEILETKVMGLYAVAKARVRLEPGYIELDQKGWPTQVVPIEQTVHMGLVYQEGDWRIDLYDFLEMAYR